MFRRSTGREPARSPHAPTRARRNGDGRAGAVNLIRIEAPTHWGLGIRRSTQLVGVEANSILVTDAAALDLPKCGEAGRAPGGRGVVRV
jgi:hypothetical protein